jgi:hypothetical protein
VTAFDLRFVPLDEFIAVDEPGAEPLLGDADEALIPEGSIVVAYGDGGAGKTTLSIDLLLHLAAGDDWLGITVRQSARVALIENEGPRALFRRKLKRKRAGWGGSELGNCVIVLDEPWASFSFREDVDRELISVAIRELEIDVIAIGPVTAAGMIGAGTIQEVREFVSLVEQVIANSGRNVTFILIHHEGKSGTISGAWEGVCDTLLHVLGRGHGRTDVRIEKARWASEYHGTLLELAWADGDGFTLKDKPDDEQTAEMIVAFVAQHPGTGWGKVEDATPGIARQARNNLRDTLLRDGALVNIAKDEGGRDVLLDHVREGHRARLYLPSDQPLREAGADAERIALAWVGSGSPQPLRAPRSIGGADVGAADSHPSELPWEES